MSQRTAKDEYRYDEGLRRQEDIKTEVIAELRARNKQLLESQRMLLTALIETGDLLAQSLSALRIYRVHMLHGTDSQLSSSSHCAVDCLKHVWDSKDGWKRREA